MKGTKHVYTIYKNALKDICMIISIPKFWDKYVYGAHATCFVGCASVHRYVLFDMALSISQKKNIQVMYGMHI